MIACGWGRLLPVALGHLDPVLYRVRRVQDHPIPDRDAGQHLGDASGDCSCCGFEG